MKDIQVVYIITKLELGGAQKVCLSLFEGIQKFGFASHLISGKNGILADQVRNNDHVILLDSIKREFRFSGIWQELKSFFNLVKTLKTLKKKNPTIIVHTHSTKAGLIGRWAAFCAGIRKRVHTIHGYAFHEFQPPLTWSLIFLLEWITSLITTHYICVSSKDVQTGLHLFPRFHKKNSIIRAAVEWEQFYQPAIRDTHAIEKPFIFGTVSCFKPQKNLLDLLRAFHLVHQKHSNSRLEIVGDGIMRTEIERFIHENKLENSVTLHGWQHNVPLIMKNWHAFVLSSLWEGLPCAVVEARLMHLPVISYDTGGIHDVIFHQENGLLYRKNNWHGLAHGMISIISEKNLYTKLQTHHENLYEFKKEHMIQEHIQLYKRLTR